MDSTDLKILKILQQDGRISMKDLGKKVGLTSPAVSERVKRLEENGIIIGYKAIVNPKKLNKNISALIDVAIRSENYKKFLDFVPKNNNIIECHHVTGGDCMIIKVMVETMEDLENLIDDLKKFGNTQTNIILSSPIESKIIL
ncbi:Lrp/AsnC family transcriptional regulator [Paramaledivibacter caminithermalis]|jgi:Lrp/AsnC family leucine-responsive transcriptional regulator|uniref:Lrp/AsnC family transcriptional regulator, leucine-responsive regulatory protein n=1 Tax=Paramaledivibacter caminithermalis (strain DSM 15212 / CIP 107654 / DViRD3) TaxID=1121301 RepID=A0A1M6T002_PARC5|nr:Lrp/AsnC family transcriptional regulator [Paramaledivibacter caminithermalis]SHK50247.1 Lrp/AsnC family transcriptional regulator, leucine-responsive regulatory protein [Paramaledivibacter caminithermalis DSM 15212]